MRTLNQLFVTLLLVSLNQGIVPQLSDAAPAAVEADVSKSSVLISGNSAWALQSLSHLIEDHRCAISLPTSFSLEPQTTNRYEMASLLAACLEHLGDRGFNPDEQQTLQTLRSEFRLELAALRGNSASTSTWRSDLATNVGSFRVEYTHALDARDQNRLAMGLHYASAETDEADQNLLGLNAEANLGKVSLFGRYSFALRSTATQSEELLSDRNLQIWTAGIGIRDFILPKSLLTLSAGQTSGLKSLQQTTQINYGAFYQFPIGERLVLSPSVVMMTPSSNSGTAPNIQGALQASFSF